MPDSPGALPHRDLIDEPLDGVDALLVTPGFNAEVREASLEGMRRAPKSAAISVPPLSSALNQSPLDELSASASWRSLFEELLGR
jgi:hypothetical protein